MKEFLKNNWDWMLVLAIILIALILVARSAISAVVVPSGDMDFKGRYSLMNVNNFSGNARFLNNLTTIGYLAVTNTFQNQEMANLTFLKNVTANVQHSLNNSNVNVSSFKVYAINATNETLLNAANYSMDYSRGLFTLTSTRWQLGYNITLDYDIEGLPNTLNAGDLYVQGNINGSMAWDSLGTYPAACPAGSAVTALNDSVTCEVLGSLINVSNLTQNVNTTGNITTNRALMGAGLNLAPSISFQNDPNTGFFSYNPDQIGIALGGTLYNYFSASGVAAVGIRDIAGTTFLVQGGIGDSGSATAVAINSLSNLVTYGSKILSIRNTGSEVAYFDMNGSLSSNGSFLNMTRPDASLKLYAKDHDSFGNENGESIELWGLKGDSKPYIGWYGYDEDTNQVRGVGWFGCHYNLSNGNRHSHCSIETLDNSTGSPSINSHFEVEYGSNISRPNVKFPGADVILNSAQPLYMGGDTTSAYIQHVATSGDLELKSNSNVRITATNLNLSGSDIVQIDDIFARLGDTLNFKVASGSTSSGFIFYPEPSTSFGFQIKNTSLGIDLTVTGASELNLNDKLTSNSDINTTKNITANTFLGSNLAGAGNGYACVNSIGEIYRSGSICV